MIFVGYCSMTSDHGRCFWRLSESLALWQIPLVAHWHRGNSKVISRGFPGWFDSGVLYWVMNQSQIYYMKGSIITKLIINQQSSTEVWYPMVLLMLELHRLRHTRRFSGGIFYTCLSVWGCYGWSQDWQIEIICERPRTIHGKDTKSVWELLPCIAMWRTGPLEGTQTTGFGTGQTF